MTTTNLITITESAARKIREFSDGAPEEMGLRLSIVGGGCSGLSYKMGLEPPPEDGSTDKIFEEQGVKLFIDRKSAVYLAGATIDYVEGLMQSGFSIQNPNASSTCGCGQSFH